MKHTSLIALTIILLLFAVGSVAAQDVSLDDRGYLVYIPSTYEDGEAMPLVIALHGYGDTVSAFAQGTGLAESAEDYGFIIGFLGGYEREWNVSPGGSHDEDDTAAVLDFIELIADEVTIDRARIYLLGFSNGAAMTYTAACEAPDTFAAIAAVGGYMWQEQPCDDVQTSVLIMHGLADNVVSFNGHRGNTSVVDTMTFWAEMNACADDDVHAFDEEYTGLQIKFYDECADGNMVMLYAIPNLRHTWPGANQRAQNRPIPNELNANFIIWGFFEISYAAQQGEDLTSVDNEPE